MSSSSFLTKLFDPGVDFWSFSAQHLVRFAVDATIDRFTLIHTHHAASHGF